MLRDVLRSTFPKLHEDDIKSQTMGMTGMDIVLSPKARKVIPYSFECKNKERMDLWKSLQQTDPPVVSIVIHPKIIMSYLIHLINPIN